MDFLIGILILIIVLILISFIENKYLTVSSYILEQESVPKEFDGLRFICIADLHNNSYGKHNERLLKYIHQQKPDAILIAGDMIVAATPQKVDVALHILEELASSYPVYYAPGNHEAKWEEAIQKEYPNYELKKSYFEKLNEMGIIYLSNQSIILQKNKQTLQITGLNIPLQYYKKGGKPIPFSKEELKQLIGNANSIGYQILLAHMPLYFETYASWGADFVFSGHVHGGVIHFPFLGGVISPQYELFPKYDEGIFKSKKATMILTRGLGTHTLPIRLFNHPELIVVEIKKKYVV